MESKPPTQLELLLEVLEHLWAEGALPPNGLPCGPSEKARLERLLASIVEAQTLALTIASGDLSTDVRSRGILIGGLKALQERLSILARQVRLVADGDLSQRVEFMGEFAAAFNEMVRSVEDGRHHLRRREADLSSMNARLEDEILQRVQAQEKLEVANKTLHSQLIEIQSLQAKLQEQAIRDSLTGLFNRRFLEETLERTLAAAARSRSDLTIILLDLDHFKDFNDQCGHEAGDTVLRVIGQLLRTNTRSSDVACRYGGEEFIIVLPGATLEAACQRAEYLRNAFEKAEILYEGKILQATLSAGVSAYPCHGSKGDDLIRAADAALYGAKRTGRNKVVLAT
jgi:diguanylate cyclase (GGDEF)-like protein